MAEGKRPPQAADMRTRHDVFKHYAPETGTDEIPEWAKRNERTALRSEVDTERQLRDTPRPVTPRAKETLDTRVIEEIFGSRECMEWYVNWLREAIETMNGDKLYDFIRRHPKYAMTGFQAWNSDFARLIGLRNIPAQYGGKNVSETNRRIAAAAQRVLVDKYENDVFQLTFTGEKVNPWIFIDGKMGPYTVSVLNDYWMAKYSSSSAKQPIPPGRSGLNEKSYSRKGNNWALFAAALRYLDVQTRQMPAQETPPADTSPERDYGAAVKGKYAEKDKAGEIPPAKLIIPETKIDLAMTLAQALGTCYQENYQAPDTARSPRTFRVLRLASQKIGERAVDQMKLESGDTLKITPQGVLSITKKNGSKRYPDIQLT